MTDAQFLAEFHPDKMRRTVTAVDDDNGLNDTITKLAEERLRRHPPGAPYTADEIVPLLDDPDNHDQAARIAALLNKLPGTGRQCGKRATPPYAAPLSTDCGRGRRSLSANARARAGTGAPALSA
ncbi:hypothetical protein ABZ370_40475 [Streptomyces sp. NPDC005962]|uniref:hypothetical protein n=1 Tax=Streptomyces sp. NPDC005962 TaxID=3154466 RepID=UPI0033C23677